MAIFKVVNEPYSELSDLYSLIKYILHPEKCKSGLIGGGSLIYNCTIDNIYLQFIGVKNAFNKLEGNQNKHFILSFDPYWDKHITPEKAYTMAQEISAFISTDYQVLFSIHENKNHLHIHFIFNTVSFKDGLKYTSTIKDFYNLQSHIGYVCYDNKVRLLA